MFEQRWLIDWLTVWLSFHLFVTQGKCDFASHDYNRPEIGEYIRVDRCGGMNAA